MIARHSTAAVNPLRRLKDSSDSVPVAWEGRRGVDQAAALPSPRPLTAYLWSLSALLLGLAMTVAVHLQQRERQRSEQVQRHTELADKSFAALQTQFDSAELLLRAAQTLFLASDEVTAPEFGDFYANLRPRERLPSLQALTYANREMLAGGEHYVVRWVQPRRGNEGMIGLGVETYPPNMAVLRQSRDSDQVTLSAPYRLGTHAAAAGPVDGVVLRLATYSPGATPRGLSERRVRANGSVAMLFRVADLISNPLPDGALRTLHLRVGDITGGIDQVLFDSHPGRAISSPGFRFERNLVYGGRVWNVAMQSLDSGPPAIQWRDPALLTGLLASVLLALLLFSIASTRQRALDLGNQMSRRYRESEQRFRALNDLLPALVLLADAASGRITYANQACRERLGARVGERDLPDLFAQPGLLRLPREPDAVTNERTTACLHHESGARFWADVAISHVVLGGQRKLLMVATDVTEQRDLTEKLSYQASHDALTDLYNRREFEHRLDDLLLATGRDSTLSMVLYVDLDQFKLINDTSGHPAGDQLLAQLAIVMHRQLGAQHVLARLGGDEFGVLAIDIADRGEAEAIAEGLRRCIDGYVFLWELHSYSISASVGAVLIDRPGLIAKDLLADADSACYLAKDTGRNRVQFHSRRDDGTVRRRGEMEWVHRLRRAIDEQRLILVYQEINALPLVAEADDVRVEVLLRFRDESGELVVPGVFMTAAERYGLMPAIDRWVVETTLANFDRLHPVGAGLRLAAINLSGASVEDDSLAEQIIEWLQHYQVVPQRVCFEVTETVAVRRLSQVVRFMERLRRAGCKVAMDDFGAGMSSFTYLKNLPLDIIKIDGSFVRDMLTDPVSHLMVKAVTDIGHRLGLDIVAEWVTDLETVHALDALGVNLVQGFALHHPEPVCFQRD